MLNCRYLHYFWSVARSGGITRASERLHLKPQTLSGQPSQFEQQLGTPLFRRAGRRMQLTESGQPALSYAEEIFQVGAEIEAMLRRPPEERPLPFRVGIADAVPKTITHRLLSPVLRLSEPVRLICREDRLDRWLAELAIHHLDMVLADRPIPANMDVKGHSHPLGQCGVAFLAEPALAEKLGGVFPASLNDAPLLIPGQDSAVTKRRSPAAGRVRRLAGAAATAGGPVPATGQSCYSSACAPPAGQPSSSRPAAFVFLPPKAFR